MGNMSYLTILPEIVLLVGALLVLMAAVALDRPRREWMSVAWLSLVLATAGSMWQWLRVDDLGEAELSFATSANLFNPMVVMDHFSAFGGVLIFVVAGVALGASWLSLLGENSRYMPPVWPRAQAVAERAVELKPESWPPEPLYARQADARPARFGALNTEIA